MMKYLLIICGMLLLIECVKCNKPCKEAKYQFSIQEIFFPEKDSITIGDTLWVIAQHSTTFKDSLSNTEVNFSDSKIGTSIGILQFTGDSTIVTGAIKDFGIVKIFGAEIGSDNSPTQNKGFQFQEENNQYILKIGFIPKNKGMYSISLSDDFGILTKRGGCEKAFI